MTAALTDPRTLHPFLAAGMGEGPYSFAGCFDLRAATDPTSAANFGNMTGAVKDAPKLEAGLGTCACCGHGIMHIFIVKDAAGKLWGVGSDCIMKLDEQENRILRHGVEKALADRRREARQRAAALKAEAKAEAERPEREKRQRMACIAALLDCKERYQRAQRNAPLCKLLFGDDVLDRLTGQHPRDEPGALPWINELGRWETTLTAGFMMSIFASLLNGELAHQLPPRARHLIAEIDAKAKAGRKGSRGYEARYDEITRAIEDTATDETTPLQP